MSSFLDFSVLFLLDRTIELDICGERRAVRLDIFIVYDTCRYIWPRSKQLFRLCTILRYIIYVVAKVCLDIIAKVLLGNIVHISLVFVTRKLQQRVIFKRLYWWRFRWDYIWMCLKSVSLAGYHGKAGWCSVPVFVRRRVAGQRSWQSLASKWATTLVMGSGVNFPYLYRLNFFKA